MRETVRKNFVFDKNIALYLKELSDETKRSMTSLIQDMIQERYNQKKAKKRLEAFNNIKGSATGLLTEFSLQSAKKNKNV